MRGKMNSPIVVADRSAGLSVGSPVAVCWRVTPVPCFLAPGCSTFRLASNFRSRHHLQIIPQRRRLRRKGVVQVLECLGSGLVNFAVRGGIDIQHNQLYLLETATSVNLRNTIPCPGE